MIQQMFDKKAAKELALQNPDQYDIDGRLLAVGDEVLYANARYGRGFYLCHGVIKEFKAVPNSGRVAVFTVIQNLADEDEVSTVSFPTQLVYKK